MTVRKISNEDALLEGTRRGLKRLGQAMAAGPPPPRHKGLLFCKNIEFACFDRLDKWDKRFRNVAEDVALWSKDPFKGVGAVVVSPDKRRVSWGYNGFPAGVADDDRLNDKELKNRLMVHAELNAILNARTDLTGWTLYCTKAPCLECASAVIQAGITRIVFAEPDPDGSWYDRQLDALRALNEAGVKVLGFYHNEEDEDDAI